MIQKTTEQLFDDEFYDLLDESYDTTIYDNLKATFGDILIYNTKKQNIDIISRLRCNKEDDKRTLGIIIKENDDMTIDIMMKNYLTTESIIIPIEYYNKPNNIAAFVYQLFNRYCNKFKRISNINIDMFNFYIPNIAQMDYILQNILQLENILESCWNTDRKEDFIKRLFTNGVICQYKNKLYQWLPVSNKERKIYNLECFKHYELLPLFTLKYDFS